LLSLDAKQSQLYTLFTSNYDKPTASKAKLLTKSNDKIIYLIDLELDTSKEQSEWKSDINIHKLREEWIKPLEML
jgi:hypothetical protein